MAVYVCCLTVFVTGASISANVRIVSVVTPHRRNEMKQSRFRSRYVMAGVVGPAMAPGPAILPTTAAEAATGCRVSYTVSSQWQGGFGASVNITNLGDAVTSWRLTWSFGAGQTVTQLWNGSVSQSGAQVTVTNASYNGAIAAGGSTAFGF